MLGVSIYWNSASDKINLFYTIWFVTLSLLETQLVLKSMINHLIAASHIKTKIVQCFCIHAEGRAVLQINTSLVFSHVSHFF